MYNLIIKTVLGALIVAISLVKGQWVVTDPSNLAQGIVNSANEIVQTSSK